MTKKCVLHVGMHKTGTTSIQNSLTNYEDENFFYAQLGGHGNHSVPMFSVFSSAPEKHFLNRTRSNTPGQLAQYIDQISAELRKSIKQSGERTLLISGEDIGLLKEHELSGLKEFLSSFYENIQIIAYIRPPQSFMNSAFQQTVRSGRRVAMNLHNLYRNYQDSFEKFDQVFGIENVLLKAFDRSKLIGGDSVVDFCSEIGLNLAPHRIVRANESSSKEFVCLLFQYNRYCKSTGKEPMSGGEAHRINAFLSHLGNTKFQFSPDLLRNILDRNARDLEWIEKRLGRPLRESSVVSSPTDVHSESDLLAPIFGAKRVLLAALKELEIDTRAMEPISDVELFHEFRNVVFGAKTTSVEIKIEKKEQPNSKLITKRGKRRLARLRNRQPINDGSGQVGSGPRPLLNADKRFMVYWSPKSACTTTYVWFSKISGFEGELAEFGDRIHQHRIKKYYSSDLYRRSKDVSIEEFLKLRIIRDPYSRAVSIYRHALKTRFADEHISSVMGPRFMANKGFSFQEFLEFLEKIDIWAANVHIKPQFHRLETEFKPTYVINISRMNLFSSLNLFEEQIGLEKTNFEDLNWLHTLEDRRKAKQEPLNGEALDETPFSRHQVARLGQFPSYVQLLTPSAKARIEAIYKADFDAYRDYL